MSSGKCKATRYHYTPIRVAKIQNNDNTKFQKGCGVTEILIHCGWECKMVQPLWKTVWLLLKKLNILLPYDPATVVLLGIYQIELKIHVHKTKQNKQNKNPQKTKKTKQQQQKLNYMIHQLCSLVFTQKSKFIST